MHHLGISTCIRSRITAIINRIMIEGSTKLRGGRFTKLRGGATSAYSGHFKIVWVFILASYTLELAKPRRSKET